ncbi:MAG: hypothetical protein KAT35_01865 [Candidatus Aenigmarchaeota archaeon]|nr:hypothetical protein [Candidatus Aenigmarchaeota archaeon]
MCYAVDILEVVVWPALLLVVVLYFRQPLKGLLKRLKKAQVPGVFEFLESAHDSPHTPPRQEAAGSLAKLFATDKPASAYWLGSDLMWTVDMILRGAPKEIILRGLKQSLHHFDSLGLKDEPDGTILTKLKVKMARMLDKELNTQVRNEYAKELLQVMTRTGDHAARCQSNFTSGL